MSQTEAQPAVIIKAEEVFSDLTQFQQALSGHMDWLGRWYQAVLNRSSDTDDIPDASAECCPFCDWHAGPNVPFRDELEQKHRAIHDKAREMTSRALAAQTLTTSDYESLMALVLAFTAAAQSSEREAWKVLATIDPLTGLGNRQTLMTQLVAERDRSLRYGQPCCVALADIDHFKKVNDTFGHAQGDRVLRAVGSYLKQAVRPYDTVYRYGGEEFLICLPGASLQVGLQVLDRMRQGIANLAISDAEGRPMPVTVTFGFAPITGEYGVEEAIELADKALYEGKHSGRNRVCASGPI